MSAKIDNKGAKYKKTPRFKSVSEEFHRHAKTCLSLMLLFIRAQCEKSAIATYIICCVSVLQTVLSKFSVTIILAGMIQMQNIPIFLNLKFMFKFISKLVNELIKTNNQLI